MGRAAPKRMVLMRAFGGDSSSHNPMLAMSSRTVGYSQCVLDPARLSI